MQDIGKEVQFSLGGKVLPTKSNEPAAEVSSVGGAFSPSVSLPYLMPSRSSCSAPSITAKPPLPHSRRSNSLTSTPPIDLQVVGKPADTFDGGGRCSYGACRSTKEEHLPDSHKQPGPSSASTNWHGATDHHNSTDTPTPRFAFWSKPKKPVSAAAVAFVNGEKETKGTHSERSSVPQRRGSFRGGGGSEEGKGGGGKEGGKTKGSRKPWRGHIFEKA